MRVRVPRARWVVALIAITFLPRRCSTTRTATRPLQRFCRRHLTVKRTSDPCRTFTEPTLAPRGFLDFFVLPFPEEPPFLVVGFVGLVWGPIVIDNVAAAVSAGVALSCTETEKLVV